MRLQYWVLSALCAVGLLMLALDNLEDSDHKGYYRALELPIGVGHRISSQDVQDAHLRILAKLDVELEAHCEPMDPCMSARLACGLTHPPSLAWLAGTYSGRCGELVARKARADDAARVLADPETKAVYDRGEPLKDYYEILESHRDATLDQLRESYLRISAEIESRRSALGCASRAESGSEPGAEPESDSECAGLGQRAADVSEAARVLGDDASRGVYRAQFDSAAGEALGFVSSPVILVSGPNPLSFLAPILVTLGVVYFLAQQYQQQHQQQEHQQEQHQQNQRLQSSEQASETQPQGPEPQHLPEDEEREKAE